MNVNEPKFVETCRSFSIDLTKGKPLLMSFISDLRKMAFFKCCCEIAVLGAVNKPRVDWLRNLVGSIGEVTACLVLFRYSRKRFSDRKGPSSCFRKGIEPRLCVNTALS